MAHFAWPRLLSRGSIDPVEVVSRESRNAKYHDNDHTYWREQDFCFRVTEWGISA